MDETGWPFGITLSKIADMLDTIGEPLRAFKYRELALEIKEKIEKKVDEQGEAVAAMILKARREAKKSHGGN